jgi:hypothetical protein
MPLHIAVWEIRQRTVDKIVDTGTGLCHTCVVNKPLTLRARGLDRRNLQMTEAYFTGDPTKST